MTTVNTKTKFRSGLPIFIIALTCASGLVATRPAHAGMLGMSEQQEIEAGKQVAAQAQKEFGRALPANDPMSIRVRRIGMQFAHLSTRRNIPYSYTVLDNEKVLNAFAAPGGPIFVTRKLMETVSNDAELAYVVGHETTHIEKKHIVKATEKQQKVGIVAGVLGAIIGRGKGGNVIGAVSNVAFSVWSSGYSREHENEADAGGVRWMAQLGYDPHAAITMLGKLGDGPDGTLGKVLADHPAPRDRQQKVQQLITAENLQNVARQHGGPRLNDSGYSNNRYGYNDPNTNPNNGGYDNSGYPNDNNGSYGNGSNGGYANGSNRNGNSRNNGDYRNTGSTDNGGTDTSGDVYPDDNGSTASTGDDPYGRNTSDDPSSRSTDGNGNSYPDYGQNTGYPNTGDDNTGYNAPAGQDLDFGDPLRFVTNNNTRVVMAPVPGFARWADATTRNNGNVTTLRRNNSTLELRRNSTVAYVNGRALDMSAPVQVFNGTLYAPLGTLAAGAGGKAAYNNDENTITVTLNDRNGTMRLP